MSPIGFLNKYLEESENCTIEEILNDEEFLEELSLRNDNFIN